MIVHFGYRDASGEYFVTLDAARCDGCGACIDACPKGALEKTTAFVELEDKTVAGVKEGFRRRLRETCSDCMRGRAPGPATCAAACERGCLTVVWSEATSAPSEP